MERNEMYRTALTYVRQAVKKEYDKKHIQESDGLALAAKLLREARDAEETKKSIADEIGNCYIPHLNRTENDFEQGYNSAIRDVLDILLKRGRTNG